MQIVWCSSKRVMNKLFKALAVLVCTYQHKNANKLPQKGWECVLQDVEQQRRCCWMFILKLFLEDQNLKLALNRRSRHSRDLALNMGRCWSLLS